MSLPNAPFSVVWPRSEMTVALKPLAPRLDTLQDKTIAFCWDHLFRGDFIWDVMKTELESRYPGVKFVDHEAFGSTHGGDEHAVMAALPGKLKSLGVNAVISGIGA